MDGFSAPPDARRSFPQFRIASCRPKKESVVSSYLSIRKWIRSVSSTYITPTIWLFSFVIGQKK